MEWELTDIIGEHKKEQFGASFDTDYKVVEQCTYDCPACRAKKLVEWLRDRGGSRFIDKGDLYYTLPWEEWQELRRQVGL